MKRVLPGWAAAVLCAATVGSVVQTQFNLAALAGLGTTIDVATRLRATVHDLAHFAPLYGVVVAVSFALAWPVAALLAKRLPDYRAGLFTLAGFTAVLVMLLTMNAVMPVTPVAATRNPVATGLMGLAGAAAGRLYAGLVKT